MIILRAEEEVKDSLSGQPTPLTCITSEQERRLLGVGVSQVDFLRMTNDKLQEFRGRLPRQLQIDNDNKSPEYLQFEGYIGLCALFYSRKDKPALALENWPGAAIALQKVCQFDDPQDLLDALDEIFHMDTSTLKAAGLFVAASPAPPTAETNPVLSSVPSATGSALQEAPLCDHETTKMEAAKEENECYAVAEGAIVQREATEFYFGPLALDRLSEHRFWNCIPYLATPEVKKEAVIGNLLKETFDKLKLKGGETFDHFVSDIKINKTAKEWFLEESTDGAQVATSDCVKHLYATLIGLEVKLRHEEEDLKGKEGINDYVEYFKKLKVDEAGWAQREKKKSQLELGLIMQNGNDKPTPNHPQTWAVLVWILLYRAKAYLPSLRKTHTAARDTDFSLAKMTTFLKMYSVMVYYKFSPMEYLQTNELFRPFPGYNAAVKMELDVAFKAGQISEICAGPLSEDEEIALLESQLKEKKAQRALALKGQLKDVDDAGEVEDANVNSLEDGATPTDKDPQDQQCNDCQQHVAEIRKLRGRINGIKLVREFTESQNATSGNDVKPLLEADVSMVKKNRTGVSHSEIMADVPEIVSRIGEVASLSVPEIVSRIGEVASLSEALNARDKSKSMMSEIAFTIMREWDDIKEHVKDLPAFAGSNSNKAQTPRPGDVIGTTGSGQIHAVSDDDHEGRDKMLDAGDIACERAAEPMRSEEDQIASNRSQEEDFQDETKPTIVTNNAPVALTVAGQTDMQVCSPLGPRSSILDSPDDVLLRSPAMVGGQEASSPKKKEPPLGKRDTPHSAEKAPLKRVCSMNKNVTGSTD